MSSAEQLPTECVAACAETAERLRASLQALEEKSAALERLRTVVAEEMGKLHRLADEGLDDDSVYYSMTRLIEMLPVEMQPADPSTMVGFGASWSDRAR